MRAHGPLSAGSSPEMGDVADQDQFGAGCPDLGEDLLHHAGTDSSRPR